MVFLVGAQNTIRQIEPGTLLFLVLSGLATGASWLCYYKALQNGPASVVVPIDKRRIPITIAFSYLVTLSRKAAVGLCLIVAGALLMLVPLPV